MNKECVSYVELRTRYTKGVDYLIESKATPSDILVAAPHGGLIEPLTTETAKIIAGSIFNFYSFTGLVEDPHMHITSHLFDEPKCVKIAKSCGTVLTVHGCSGDKEKVVYVGGLDLEKRFRIAHRLRTLKGVRISSTGHRFKGEHPDNICNRGAGNKGVQLELSSKLREDKKLLLDVSKIVHNVLLGYN